MDTIGSRIKAERKRAGITQAELAKKLGLATGTIQQYELGKRQPNGKMLQRIAGAINCSTANFFPECTHLADFVRQAEKALAESAEAYQELNGKGRAEAIKRIKELAQLPQYTE